MKPIRLSDHAREQLRFRGGFAWEVEETMRITYDRQVDALYLRFRDTTVTTEHWAEGIAADYDSQGRLAGIEILDATCRLGDLDVLRRVIVEGLGSTD